MPDLINSQRISYKATYVPSTISLDERPQVGRALEKLALVRSLNMQPDELNALRTSGNVGGDLLDLVERVSNDPSSSSLQRYGPALAAVRLDNLAGFGNALAALRSRQSNDLAAQTRALVESVTYRGPIEPVGWLHLERLEMTPVGVEHGELVHSVPLAPKETVNITHREWTVTTQTFESLIQDSLEGFSETGVTEKTDLTQATDTESKHTSALDVNGAMSATYNGGSYSVTASAGIHYNQMSEDSQSQKDSMAHAVAITKQASSRTRKEHKTSFRVSSVAGAEDLAVQVITNPSDTDAMRVDYFQLLRRWRVDLIRYGLRMTYDLVIPNPGLDLISQLQDLSNLDALINTPPNFPLAVAQITPDTWITYAAQYNANVDPPPELTRTISSHKEIDKSEADAADYNYDFIDFDVDENYYVDRAQLTMDANLWTKDAHNFVILGIGHDTLGQSPVDLPFLQSLSGSFSVVYRYQGINRASISVTLSLKVKDSVLQAWQFKAWESMSQAYLQAYEQNHQVLKEQRDALAAKIGQWDALTLRKMEREEIMRFVLTWLIGPTFELMPPEIQSLFVGYPDPSVANPPQYAYKNVNNMTLTEWTEVVQGRGELIKFLHNAIEWENALFFVYPYFWDDARNWPFKRFLVHPDPIHREFLRSGCARVVLTVRPGFELAFAYLLETGDATQPPPQPTPYVTIAEETRNFAMTNYENIPPANPDNNVRELLLPEQRQAWTDIQALMQLLEQYKTAQGRYPTTAEGLQALQGLPSNPTVPSTDPWGNPYDYRSPGLHNDYDLVSYGANGQPGGTEQNSDIASWAEGSVVGRWYEYTPTSALDISIDTALPTTPGAA